MFYSSRIITPIGILIAIADERSLYLLDFSDNEHLAGTLLKLTGISLDEIPVGKNAPIFSIERDLELFFKGALTEFTTPIVLTGTPFQKKVWQTLRTIPYGETRSYLDIAHALGKPTAYRAVAQANNANKLVIIIPCHRVITAGNELSGYRGGTDRKRALLECEGIRPRLNELKKKKVLK